MRDIIYLSQDFYGISNVSSHDDKIEIIEKRNQLRVIKIEKLYFNRSSDKIQNRKTILL